MHNQLEKAQERNELFGCELNIAMMDRNEMENSDQKRVLLKAAPGVAHNTMANLGQQPRHATAWAYLLLLNSNGRKVGTAGTTSMARVVWRTILVGMMQWRPCLAVQQFQCCQSCSSLVPMATTVTYMGKQPRLGY